MPCTGNRSCRPSPACRAARNGCCCQPVAGNPGTNAGQPAQTTSAQTETCACNLASTLYGGAAAATPITYVSCCDRYTGCQDYPLNQRNAFWPSFAHPRWLPCAQLYTNNYVR